MWFLFVLNWWNIGITYGITAWEMLLMVMDDKDNKSDDVMHEMT